MKTIVVSGSCSHVGKTSLTRALAGLLPGAQIVKLGCSDKLRPGVPGAYYPARTPATALLQRHRDAAYLLIESNRILDDLRPDLTIYLDGRETKPSAHRARAMADLTSGGPAGPRQLGVVAQRLGVDGATARRIAWLAGARPEGASAVILAGGTSSRMGRDKALLEIDGVPIVRRLHDALLPHFDQVVVGIAPGGAMLVPGARHIEDQRAGQGPLMAIRSCLSSLSTRVNFVVSCDIPRIEIPLIRALLSFAADHDIVAPSFASGSTEPLFAVYTAAILPCADALLAARKYRVDALYPLCRTHVLPWPDHGWYVNLNTPAEFARYLASPHKGAASVAAPANRT